MSAYASEADRRRGLDAGFDAHLAKPVDLDTIMDVIASLAAPAAKRTAT